MQLRSKIMRLAASRERADRKKSITKYIPDVCRAVFGVLSTIAPVDASVAFGPRAVTPAASEAEQRRAAALFERVRAGDATQRTLETQLERHVEQADMEAALEEAVQATAVVDKDRVHIASFARAPVATAASPAVSFSHANVRFLPAMVHADTGARLQFFQPLSMSASLFPSAS